MIKIDIDQLNYDMTITDGQITRATNSEAIKQNVVERLLTVQQEWFMDLDQGLPWFTDLTGRNTTHAKVQGYIGASIAQTEGVAGVQIVSLQTANKLNRAVGIEFEYTDVFGETIRKAL